MSTSSKELSLEKRKNENSSTTSVSEEQDIQRKKMKSLIKCEYFADLKTWEMFTFLQPEFISRIHMIMAFDNTAALIVTKDKMVYDLSVNENGRLGISDNNKIFQPKKVEALCGRNIKTLCCDSSGGPVHALTEEGEVYSWGPNKDYRLGLELTAEEIYTPTKVNIDEKCIIDIACSFNHTIALTNDRKIYTWGDNKYAQIFKSEVILPQQVKFEFANEEIIYIACGKLFNVAITNNGSTYSWGLNDFGQLGLGDCENKLHPCLIDSLKDVTMVKVVCGAAHTLALTAEGESYFWGKNTREQFISGIEVQTVPIKLNMSKIGKVLDIATQNCLLLAIGENGSAFVWGEFFDQKVSTITEFSNVCDTFKYNWPYIIHNPLIEKEKLNILKCLGVAFDDLSTSDLTIQVEEQSIHVHKAVLKIRSQYYRNMFQDYWKENNQNIITHNEFSYIVYKAFLKYLYTATINLPPEKVLELLKLADAYDETNLKKDCVQLVKEDINVSNVFMIYKKAIKYNSKELETFCFHFALEHLTDVVQTENFINLNEKIKTEFIIKAARAGAFKK